MDEKQIKFFIEKIAVETNSLATVSVWQEWIYDIASSRSIDRISFDRETLTAYFGCLSPAFAELCDFYIKNLFSVYVEDYSAGVISWSEIEKFKSLCNDESILNEIKKLEMLNKDLGLFRKFIADFEKRVDDSVLIEYLRQCESFEVKNMMLEILKKRQAQKQRTTKPIVNRKKLKKATDSCLRDAGGFMLINYDRNEILRQYGLEHLIKVTDKK